MNDALSPDRGRVAGNAAVTIIDASGTPLLAKLAEHGRAWTLFRLLALRDIRLRYRYTSLGLSWALLQPLLPMLIFGAVFSRLDFDAGGIPYPLFVFSGLAPWIFIGNAVSGASPTFLNNFEMINKIYFPRAVLPLAVVAALTLDGAIGVAAVLGFSAWYGYGPVWSWLLLPLAGAAAIVLAMAAALIAASITTTMRDLKNAVPFLVQLWMYASPVLYPVTAIPEPLRSIAGFNPVTGLLEVFRACLFGHAPAWGILAQSSIALLAIVAAAMWLFHHLETDLAERV